MKEKLSLRINNILRNIFFIFLLQFFALFPVESFAEKIIFASPEIILPKVYRDNGVLRGTYIDIITEICKRMKVEPVFVQYPWPRAISMIKNGKVDALFPPFKTPERESYLYFPTEPVGRTRNVLFARKLRSIKINKMTDLQNYIVGVVDQYSYGPAFDDYKKNLTIDVSRNEEMQINKITHQGQVRMDVAAASEDAFRFLSTKLGHADELEVVYVLSDVPSYVAFSKAQVKNKKIAENFSRILKQLRKEGMIQEINNNYFK